MDDVVGAIDILATAVDEVGSTALLIQEKMDELLDASTALDEILIQQKIQSLLLFYQTAAQIPETQLEALIERARKIDPAFLR